MQEAQMKVIIAGSADGPTRRDIDKAMVQAAEKGIVPTLVLCGEARGADTHGKHWAQARGIDVKSFPAEWGLYGKAAGPIRNSEMVKEADALIAVWNGTSRGTRDVIQKAQRKGIPVVIYYFN
jgi:hypothetical protein